VKRLKESIDGAEITWDETSQFEQMEINEMNGKHLDHKSTLSFHTAVHCHAITTHTHTPFVHFSSFRATNESENNIIIIMWMR
jgi:hypothetical protein